MAEAADIERCVDDVVRQFRPQRVILFGSYAYGIPTTDSDVDLLIVMPYRGSNLDAAIRIRLGLTVSFALDLIVRSKREIKERIAMNDFFLAEIMEKGLVLYAADDTRMGRQGRSRLRRRLSAAQVAQA
ncbi:MAG: nucleotidyltransferase domain-containing protein [Phycisphaeraceae bacterium]